MDARKLSELLYLNKFTAVYHGQHGLRTLRELARAYIAITRDLTRVRFGAITITVRTWKTASRN